MHVQHMYMSHSLSSSISMSSVICPSGSETSDFILSASLIFPCIEDDASNLGRFFNLPYYVACITKTSQVYVHIHMYMCICTCTQLHMYMLYVYTTIHVYVHVYMYVVHVHVHVVCVYMYMYMCMLYMYMYMCLPHCP